MRLLPYIDVTNATNTFNSGQLATLMSGNCGALYFINMSNLCYEIVINMNAGAQMKAHIPSWWARPIYLQGHADSFVISGAFNPNGMSNPPFSHIAVELFENEPFDHLIDQAIPSQMSTSGNNTVTIAQELQNDGLAANQTFIESTVSGAPGSSWFATNDGLLTLKLLIAGVLHQAIKVQASGNLLQLVNAGDVVEVLGNLVIDGSMNADNIRDNDTGTLQAILHTAGITIENILTLQNGLLVGASGGAANFIEMSTGANKVLDGTNGSDLFINPVNNSAGKVSLATNSIESIRLDSSQLTTILQNFKLTRGKTNTLGNTGICAATHFSGTCPASSDVVVNHNFPDGTPNFFGLSPTPPQAGSGSIGYGNATSTQVTVTIDGTTSMTFSGFATIV